ncbi:unnamed protein product [Penicillium olsonii]|nr:unnamed protein product [Penicillium olsonii]
MHHFMLLALVALASINPVYGVTSNTSIPGVPQYVLDYVWLHSQEIYMPSDIQQQLDNTIPKVNWTSIEGVKSPLDLSNLDTLNSLGNTSVYLTSHDGIEASPQPAWFRGITPDKDGRLGNGTGSAIIIAERGNGTLDAFYFYFYAFNKGDKVLKMEFGDHIGDWEHNMIRFKNGKPDAIWYSQHASRPSVHVPRCREEREATVRFLWKWNSCQLCNLRVCCSTLYTLEAMANAIRQHDHAIPGINLPVGFVMDYTDRGRVWDPVVNAYFYTYDAKTATFEAFNSKDPVAWLNFNGKWGDDQPPGEPEIFGEAKNVAGPNGPKFKGLGRKLICPSKPCIVLPFRIWSGNSTS